MPKNEYVDTAAFSFIQNSYFTVVLAIASFHKRAIYVFMAEFVMCKRFINKKCKGTLNSRPLESVKNDIWNISISLESIYREYIKANGSLIAQVITKASCNTNWTNAIKIILRYFYGHIKFFIEILECALIFPIFLWNWNANKPYIFILRKSYWTNMTP